MKEGREGRQEGGVHPGLREIPLEAGLPGLLWAGMGVFSMPLGPGPTWSDLAQGHL